MRVILEHERLDLETVAKVRGKETNSNTLRFEGAIGSTPTTLVLRPGRDLSLVLEVITTFAVLVEIEDGGANVLQTLLVGTGDAIIPISKQAELLKLTNSDPSAALIKLFIF